MGELGNVIGRSVHRALRTLCTSKESLEAWKAIESMPDSEWEAVVEYAAIELVSFLGGEEE